MFKTQLTYKNYCTQVNSHVVSEANHISEAKVTPSDDLFT